MALALWGMFWVKVLGMKWQRLLLESPLLLILPLLLSSPRILDFSQNLVANGRLGVCNKLGRWKFCSPPALFHKCLSSFSPPPPLPDLHSHSIPDDDEKEQKKTEKACGCGGGRRITSGSRSTRDTQRPLSQNKENQRVCKTPWTSAGSQMCPWTEQAESQRCPSMLSKFSFAGL